jgi:chemotaxis response regulator CheB
MTIYETRAPQATVSPPETAGALPIGDQGTEERGAESPFPIVGIGASAGGLEAFTQFLAHLPDQTGMAFVLVQHLDPHREPADGDLSSVHPHAGPGSDRRT